MRQTPNFTRVSDIVLNLDKIDYNASKRIDDEIYAVQMSNNMADVIVFDKNNRHANAHRVAELSVEEGQKTTGAMNEPVAVVMSGMPVIVKSITFLDGNVKTIAITIEEEDPILLSDIEWIDLEARINGLPAIEIFHSGESVTQITGYKCEDVYDQIEEMLCNH